MPVLIDTNVLSDVIHADPQWRPWAEARILDYFGKLVINPIIYAELACRAASVGELEEILAPFDLEFLELPKEALFHAAHVFVSYRRSGGKRTAPQPDFFIGAHASVLRLPILTRDVGRYRSYFPEVELVTPESEP
ncbi:MAG: type II toxin-antitoxin system VapC family toxin [Puniceicoccaceae bacterium]|nr:MAG: type II toxin-antitoxin system VapC family toxin [Puniceicoccaceae bacterium]